MTSAYPIAPEVLEDRVRTLATSLGDWPSQRRVMRECRVGAPRADAALAAVRASGFDPTTAVAEPDTAPAAEPARPFTVVPNRPDPTTADGTDTHDTDTPAVERSGGDEAALVPAAGSTPAPSTPQAPPVAADEVTQVSPVAETPADTPTATREGTRSAGMPWWPLTLIAASAFVAIWGGWVGLGEMTGFGEVRLLPGIADEFVINSAITLPLGVEAYAAYALRAWLAPPPGLSRLARRFACWSALGALALGAAGQITYHLMEAAGLTRAPWQITTFVSCLPVVVTGCAAALHHLTRNHSTESREA